MSVGFSLRYDDWLRGWREWARTRKRGKMAQFIVEKLEEGVSSHGDSVVYTIGLHVSSWLWYSVYTVEPLYNGHHWDQQTCPFNGGNQNIIPQK